MSAMSIKTGAVQWTKYIVGAVAMLIASFAFAVFVSGGDDVGFIGFVMLLVFIFAAKAWFNHLGLN